MRQHFRVGALVALLFSGAAHAQDGPASLIDRFASGFSAMDPAAIASLFRPDGTFFGSTQPDLMRGPEGVQGYFTRGFASGGWRKLTCDVLDAREVSATAATVNALCRVEGVRGDGTPRSGVLRVSALALRDEAGWRFASLHVSDPPPHVADQSEPKPRSDRAIGVHSWLIQGSIRLISSTIVQLGAAWRLLSQLDARTVGNQRRLSCGPDRPRRLDHRPRNRAVGRLL